MCLILPDLAVISIFKFRGCLGFFNIFLSFFTSSEFRRASMSQKLLVQIFSDLATILSNLKMSDFLEFPPQHTRQKVMMDSMVAL